MSREPDELSDEDDFTQAVVDAVYELPGALANTAPVRHGLSVIGIMAVALLGAPLLIILTLAWALLAGPVMAVLLPDVSSGALELVLMVGPPLVVLFFLLRWGLVHLPPKVRRYFTS